MDTQAISAEHREKRVEKIIRLFLTTDCSPEVVLQFQEWLIDGHNCEMKERALRKIWDDMVEDKLQLTKI